MMVVVNLRVLGDFGGQPVGRCDASLARGLSEAEYGGDVLVFTTWIDICNGL